jgi:hypothetical protein
MREPIILGWAELQRLAPRRHPIINIICRLLGI